MSSRERILVSLALLVLGPLLASVGIRVVLTTLPDLATIPLAGGLALCVSGVWFVRQAYLLATSRIS